MFYIMAIDDNIEKINFFKTNEEAYSYICFSKDNDADKIITSFLNSLDYSGFRKELKEIRKKYSKHWLNYLIEFRPDIFLMKDSLRMDKEVQSYDKSFFYYDTKPYCSLEDVINKTIKL